MENSNLKDLIEKYLSTYNTFNIDGIIGVLNENIHFRNIEVNSETKGIQEFRTLAEQSIQVFSQRRQVIKNIIFAGDKAEASGHTWHTPSVVNAETLARKKFLI
ncbi:nuclear transport factor 2 family protein [Paenibacillus sp. ACRRY]|uniref:nuclear transport factor 2 family protein n=1 Tax=Paenibacillus sp. ACRRY TaxID=2918208 RepID=UPI001EF5143B|nr:nuclear transport factor 2 family protein [Paenibacillus sp. ACRRY]MCG7385574.1 nuclear transport factor 2 family protein [Paenibacillus sp. ACRRY]